MRHRRFRAVKVAGLTRLPAFVDLHDFDDIDQVIENVQRENLTVREVADFIGRKLSVGMTQADLAAMLGKSKAWVSQHVRNARTARPRCGGRSDRKSSDVTLANELRQCPPGGAGSR